MLLVMVAFLALPTSTAAFGFGHSEIVAQAGTGTTGTGTGSEDGQAETSEQDSGVDKEALAKVVLFFGLLVVAGLLGYLAWAQGKFYGLARLAFQRSGGFPIADWGPAAVGGAGAVADNAIVIVGPTVIVVGEEAEYSARKAGEPVKATWTVEPQEFATPQPAEGEQVKIAPKKEGAFKLIAEAEGAKALATLTAVEAGQGSSLPFVGRGYGTIVLATVLLSIAGVLALVGSFNAAVATLFGAVAGYIFSRANDEGTGSGGTESSGTGSGG